MIRRINEAVLEIGPVWLVIHDAGWVICWRQIQKAAGRWPTDRTFRGGG